jgi:hypothetical protein
MTYLEDGTPGWGNPPEGCTKIIKSRLSFNPCMSQKNSPWSRNFNPNICLYQSESGVPIEDFGEAMEEIYQDTIWAT